MSAPVVDKSSDDNANVVNQIYKNDGDGVAFIESQIPAQESQSLSPFGEPESEGGGTATGSGFVIDTEGHMLTNNHVVEGADRIQVKLGDSDKTYTAKVVGADPATDLALLDVEAPADQLHPLDARPAPRRWKSATRWSRSATPSGSTAPSPAASSPPCSARSKLPTASRSPT